MRDSVPSDCALASLVSDDLIESVQIEYSCAHMFSPNTFSNTKQTEFVCDQFKIVLEPI